MENLFICDKALMLQVINTLNSISVSGRDNMDKLLGVIMTLEAGLNPPKAEEKTEEITEESEDNANG